MKLVTRDFCVFILCINVSGNVAIKSSFISACAQMIFLFHFSCTLTPSYESYLPHPMREKEKWKTFLIKSFVSNVTYFFLSTAATVHRHIHWIGLHCFVACCQCWNLFSLACWHPVKYAFNVWHFKMEFLLVRIFVRKYCVHFQWLFRWARGIFPELARIWCREKVDLRL